MPEGEQTTPERPKRGAGRQPKDQAPATPATPAAAAAEAAPTPQNPQQNEVGVLLPVFEELLKLESCPITI